MSLKIKIAFKNNFQLTRSHVQGRVVVTITEPKKGGNPTRVDNQALLITLIPVKEIDAAGDVDDLAISADSTKSRAIELQDNAHALLKTTTGVVDINQDFTPAWEDAPTVTHGYVLVRCYPNTRFFAVLRLKLP